MQTICDLKIIFLEYFFGGASDFLDLCGTLGASADTVQTGRGLAAALAQYFSILAQGVRRHVASIPYQFENRVLSKDARYLCRNVILQLMFCCITNVHITERSQVC